MEISEEPWTCRNPAAGRLQLVQLEPSVLAALAGGDLVAARRATARDLTPYLASDDCVGVWRIRRDQLARNPADAAWVTRLAVDRGSGKVVGRAGYHGPPDEAGMVEVGYSIDPVHRRQGYARAALVILLETAREHPGISVVRASVRPDNTPSRRLLDQYGFQEVGEQWDDVDGLETVLEVPCPCS
ncbi:GNAT family N-acetyltransferase [Pseudarthrobacter sp. H2]|uniref:GNAT family N-acetyltransferase n=1 Tax=Pseudarthrobacter sp. H2 TaxID=3418415 RepID=UPI003CF275EE